MAMMMSAMAAMMKGGKGGLLSISFLKRILFEHTGAQRDCEPKFDTFEALFFLTSGNVKICQDFMGHRVTLT